LKPDANKDVAKLKRLGARPPDVGSAAIAAVRFGATNVCIEADTRQPGSKDWLSGCALELSLFWNLQRVLYLDPQVPVSTFQLGMSYPG
jgi:hypothetical protein